MQILFAISILCFVILLWATVAVTQRIRAKNRLERDLTQPPADFSQYLFEATQNIPIGESSNVTPTTQTITHFQEKAISPKRG
jgi:hypothetical protein